MSGKWANRPPSTARGYNHAHRRLRAQWDTIVQVGGVTCARYGQANHPDCPGLIQPATPWELGHKDDRSGYSGPEHKDCNQLAGRLLADQRRPREKRPTERHPGLI